MYNEVYEKILKKGADGFIKVKEIKNADDEYIDFDIIDYNDSIMTILKRFIKNSTLKELNSLENLKQFIEERFKTNKENMEIETFLKNIKENGYQSAKFLVNIYKKSLIAEGYYFGDYYIIILKFNLENEIYKFSNLLETSNSIYFWIKDINGNYITVNQKWLEETNLNHRKEAVGLNVCDVWGHEWAKQYTRNEQEVIEKNVMKTFKETFISKNGEQRCLDTTLWPVFDNDNSPIGTMGIAVEGDYKMKFYSNLRDNEMAFREIAEHCESVFFIRDEKESTYISPFYENVFEESYEPVLKDVYKFNEFFKSVENKNGLLENYSFDKKNEGKIKAKLKNGKEKWIWYKFLPIFDDNGNTIKRIGILTDITKDVNIEEEKEKIRLDFFANISHELRTPINLIISCINVLRLKLGHLNDEDFEYFSKYINIMEQNGFRLVKLINNLIDSTKIDSGCVKINLINADVINFIEDVCLSVVDFINSKEMNLIFDTETEEEILCFDPNFIERVILNLLSNAIKFNKPKGNIFVNINSDEDNVIVSIKDEGIGIPKDKLNCIFERFEQVKSKMKNEQEGSGMGLYIVKSLIEIHGGTIKAYSDKNGSEIRFTLPKKKVENQPIETYNIFENQREKIIIEFSDIYKTI